MTIADGFWNWLTKSNAKILACSILPEHVHVVIARHRYSIEQTAALLKGEATKSLAKASLHPFQNDQYRDGSLPTPWARKCWKVFLTTDEDIFRAVQYVRNNPVKEGKRRQNWQFVTALDV